MNINSYSTLNLLNLHFGNKINAGENKLSKNTGVIQPNALIDKFTPTTIRFSEPNWNDVMSKTDPAMSEDEFAEAIKAQAKTDFDNGYRRAGSTDAGNLMRQYMQVVSPDRKGLYEASMAENGGKLNQTHAIWDGGERVLTFNTSVNKWMVNGTSKEMERMQQFYEIYNAAYMESVDAHDGPVDSRNYKSDANPSGSRYNGRI